MKSFGSFRLDPVNQCLWHGEQRVSLTPKAFDVLRYLVEHPGRLVTQDEILEALWPETYVNPELIKKYILGIRKVLGDRPNQPEFIETFPRRGYQFIAPVIDKIPGSSPDALSSSTKNIVGRHAAMIELHQALRDAMRGQRQVVFVTGEAGIGKTTLVDTFHQQAVNEHNLQICRGQCVEGFGGKEAYFPVLEAIGQLARGPAADHTAQALMRLAPTWLIQLPSLLKPEQKQALQQEILGATRERMVREVCELLEFLSSQTPLVLVLVLEDLHWVDPSTLDLISALARRREPARLLLLCTYRPVDVVLSKSHLKELKQDLQVRHLCREVGLELLGESAIAEYLANEFPSSTLPSGLARLIYGHSGGNALFMAAIVQDMVKKGLIAQQDNDWKLTTPLDAIAPSVPETLQEMLQLQFDQLADAEQQVLKAASVASERFSVWAISGALQIKPAQIEEACDRLAARRQVITAAGIQEFADGSVSAHYEFRHSLYRQAISRQISESARLRLHTSIAEQLKILCERGHSELASEVAFHFEAGRAFESAVRFLMLAAQNAAARFAYRDSIQILHHALKLIPRVSSSSSAELEIQLRELLGDAFYVLGSMADSAVAYEAAASRAAQASLKAAQVSALSALIRPFGLIDPDRGISAMHEAELVSRTIDNPVLLARTQTLSAIVHLLYGTWSKEQAALCADSRHNLVALGDTGVPLFDTVMYGYVLVLQGEYQNALQIFDSTVSDAAAAGLMAHFLALGGKIVALLRTGRLGEVLTIVRKVKDLAEKNGNDPWLFNFREVWLRTLVYDFEGARRLWEIIMRPSAEYPTSQPVAIARIAAGYAELDCGNYDQAIEYFTQVIDPAATPKFFLHWAWRMTARLGLSNVALKSGDIVKARKEADSFFEAAMQTADPHLQVQAWELKGRVAIAGNGWPAARECVRQALAILDRFDVPVVAWQVHALAHQLYRHDGNHNLAQEHCAWARSFILKIADSFASDEPLRETFLKARPVADILSSAPQMAHPLAQP